MVMLRPSTEGVRAAAQLLRGRVVKTPVLESRLLNEELGGGRLLVKAECLQTTGSFKYRGALHRLLRLQADDPAAAARGVVAFSSGNFGQALAAAATALGVRCTIVSPHDAPPLKLERIERYGARLTTSTAPPGVNREVVASALARSLASDEGLTLLHPFDDAHVVHGQGTIGVEFLEQAQELLLPPRGAARAGAADGSGGDEREWEGLAAGRWPGGAAMDTIVVPCGGGGMTAGICLAVEEAAAAAAARGGVAATTTTTTTSSTTTTTTTGVMTVEPTGFDDHARSFAASQRLSLADIYGDGKGSGGGAGQGGAAPMQARRGRFPMPRGTPDSSSSSSSSLKRTNARPAVPAAALGAGGGSYPIPAPADKSVACDALMAGAPGELTWAVNGPRLAGAVAVASDDRVGRAMRVAFDHFRLVLEPSGALALAAVLDGLERDVWERRQSDGGGGGGPVLPSGRVVGIIACGGNTDFDTFTRMAAYSPSPGGEEGH
jgi:threonine dehydratase